jgi:diketogulonate reductase-like aldo/keto reductase
MKEELNLYTSERYNSEIEEIVERTSMSYLDAMLYHADENGLESETVAGLINVKTKTKLREEAEQLNFMPKTSKLPI